MTEHDTAQLDPGQLDRLEDALEMLDALELELDEVAHRYELDDSTKARFAAYRELGQRVGDALVPVPVPEAAYERAMAAVAAEATGVAMANPMDPSDRSEPTAGEVAGGWARWWKRWRAAAVPLATLAGTAALVLWVVRPDATGSLGDVPTLAQAPARPAPKVSDGEKMPHADTTLAPGPDSAAKQAVPKSTASGGSVERRPEAAEAAAAPAKMQEQRSAKTGSSGSGTLPIKEENIIGPHGYTEQPAVDSEDPKGQLYARLTAAHGARRNGNCTSAVVKYEALLGQPDLDAIQRAQAEGGLGLCRELQGNATRASTHFNSAREADPTIEAWIESERVKTPAQGEKSKRKSLPKKTSTATQSNAALDAL